MISPLSRQMMALWSLPSSRHGVATNSAGPPSARVGAQRLDRLVAALREGGLQHQVLGGSSPARTSSAVSTRSAPCFFASARAAAHLGEIAGDVADLGIELGERDLEAVRHDQFP